MVKGKLGGAGVGVAVGGGWVGSGVSVGGRGVGEGVKVEVGNGVRMGVWVGVEVGVLVDVKVGVELGTGVELARAITLRMGIFVGVICVPAWLKTIQAVRPEAVPRQSTVSKRISEIKIIRACFRVNEPASSEVEMMGQLYFISSGQAKLNPPCPFGWHNHRQRVIIAPMSRS